jgi:hypothetical protein
MLQSYIVDNDGDIDFPLLGTVHLAGLTKKEAERHIRDKIRSYMNRKEKPIVTVRMINYKISVIGEVAKPGMFTVANEKISILEALAQAGDLTIYGRRDRVKLIREDATGEKNIHVLNLNDASQTTKSVKLWCPEPDGEGDNQSKTFTFYGLTTPQDATFHAINGNDQSLGFSFTVTYPDPMNPQGAPLVKTYQGAFGQTVNFNSGVCTTLNISLNHWDEQMFMDVTYNDWNFVSTPDLGELRKKSTFMDINSAVTTHDMPTATIDDATWLYISGDAVKDIYGNDGTQEHPYRITSASQLLSFAKEVKGGMTFEDKYIRLDADITMQASTAKTSAEDADSKVSPVSWIGIGDAAHAFHGTLLGGDRYINRLCGSPLFLNLGTKAVVEQLHVTTIGSISGGGALAETNAGVIGGCKVIDDVDTTGGALVGTNDGIVYACYHTGLSNGNRLIGQDHGNTIGCYQASDITSFDEALLKSLVATLNTSLTTWYASHPNLTEFTFVYSPASYPTVKRNQ